MRNLSHLVLAALAYFVTAQLGNLFAIAPGYASGIWPASGVALACVLLTRSVPAAIGIGLSSLVANFGFFLDIFSILNRPTTLIVSIIIATGVCSQALAGRYLWHRLLGAHYPIETPKQATLFLLIIAPISCLISSSVGSTTLFFAGVIQGYQLATSWFTWWVGDTIGVILFTPLIIAVLNTSFPVIARITTVLPTLVLFLGITVLFHTSTQAHRSDIQKRINNQGYELQQKVVSQLRAAEKVLTSFSTFYKVAGNVSQAQFEQMTDILVAHNPAIRSIAWIPPVKHAARLTIERRMRAEGYTDFTFTERNDTGALIPASQRSVYFPLLYIYPSQPNQQAHGYDIGSNRGMLTALHRAEDSGHAVISAPVQLAQSSNNDKSFVMYIPIFDHSAAPSAEHSHQLRGFIGSAFNLEAVLHEVKQQAELKGINYQLLDISTPSAPIEIKEQHLPPLPRFDTYSATIDFGNRQYQLNVQANHRFPYPAKDWRSWLILITGFIFAGFLQLLLLMLKSSQLVIGREVVKQTQALEQAKLQAEQASTAKTQFLANMSHEFRTPLNAIIGFTKLCLKEPLSRKQQSHLENVQLASNSLLALINDTLDFSKIEAGKIDLYPEPHHLNALCDKMQALFKHQAQEKNIEFRVQKTQAPDCVLVDVLRIEQVLLNLCANAVKFTNQGYVELRLTCIALPNHHTHCTFEIQDTGIGISPEQQQKIFHAFEQADTSLSRNFGGTGLGLSISQQLIDLMAGEISLTSHPNEGSTFKIELTLPTAEAKRAPELATPLPAALAPATVPKPTVPAPASDHALAPLQGVHILLAEDNLINQALAETILTDLGATVYLTGNGAEAINALQQQAFDCILMDIQMPEMDGLEATRRIRSDAAWRNLPIIGLSAHAHEQDVAKSLDAGMDAHLSKPIDEDILIDTITSYLKRD